MHSPSAVERGGRAALARSLEAARHPTERITQICYRAGAESVLIFLRSDHKILARITRACGATPTPVQRGCLHAIQNLWFRQPISAKRRHWESVPSNI